jgi:hypothetical protein
MAVQTARWSVVPGKALEDFQVREKRRDFLDRRRRWRGRYALGFLRIGCRARCRW